MENKKLTISEQIADLEKQIEELKVVENGRLVTLYLEPNYSRGGFNHSMAIRFKGKDIEKFVEFCEYLLSVVYPRFEIESLGRGEVPKTVNELLKKKMDAYRVSYRTYNQEQVQLEYDDTVFDRHPDEVFKEIRAELGM